MRTFYIFAVNCGCSSYTTTRTSLGRSGSFPRCDYCRRQLGDFSWKYLGKTRAVNSYAALGKYKGSQMTITLQIMDEKVKESQKKIKSLETRKAKIEADEIFQNPHSDKYKSLMKRYNNIRDELSLEKTMLFQRKERRVDMAQIAFDTFVETWKNETSHLSNVAEKIKHPAYQGIIELGDVSVQLLLTQLITDHDDWFPALSKLTGENPVKPEHAGIVESMVADWWDWGLNNGYLIPKRRA